MQVREKIKIQEADRLVDVWKKQARMQTMDTVEEFCRELLENYEHDYGTICHAIAAGAIAMGSAMNQTDQGHITGFQASGIMWEFVRGWIKEDNKCGLKMLDYDWMLFPQYADRFDRVIDGDTWAAIQKEAAVKIADYDSEKSNASKEVLDHWKSIAAGKVPHNFIVKKES